MTCQAAVLFDRWAEAGRGEAMARGHWPLVSQILDRMALGPGLSCLDVGCGNGYAVRAMAARVGEAGQARGVDVSPAMIARAIAETNPPQISYRVAPADVLPYDDGVFDRLLSVEAIYYLPDPRAALAEWVRVLKPGGSLWVMLDFYQENPYSRCWAELIDLPMHYLPEARYRELLQAVGLTGVFSDRLLHPEPVDAATFRPGWGYETAADVIDFRTRIGSLLVGGVKPL